MPTAAAAFVHASQLVDCVGMNRPSDRAVLRSAHSINGNIIVATWEHRRTGVKVEMYGPDQSIEVF